MHKPSDYVHAYGERPVSHWDEVPIYDGELVEDEPPKEPMGVRTALAITTFLDISNFLLKVNVCGICEIFV